jgi:Ca2+-binding EF-hand superfamily protein
MGKKKSEAPRSRKTSGGLSGKQANVKLSQTRRIDLEAAFRKFDTDGDGVIDHDELLFLIQQTNPAFPSSDIHLVMGMIDKDASATLDLHEFVALIREIENPDNSLEKARDRQLEAYAKAFAEFDTGGDGKISVSELSVALSALGMTRSPEQLAHALATIDADGDGDIDLDEFILIVNHGISAPPKETRMLSMEELLLYEETFRDFDRDGDGTIDVSELHVAMRSLGHKMSDEELRVLIKEVDVDGNGSLEFSEFLVLLGVEMPKRLVRRMSVAEAAVQEVTEIEAGFSRSKSMTEEQLNHIKDAVDIGPFTVKLPTRGKQSWRNVAQKLLEQVSFKVASLSYNGEGKEGKDFFDEQHQEVRIRSINSAVY